MCLCQQSLTSILTFKNRFDFDAILSYLNNLNNHKVKTIRAAAGQAAVSAMFLLPRIQTPPEKVRRKKKPVIDQCWIHRVLGSVTIIQRSSRNFMHEFLSCCLARILSAGWTQHCYAKCKKNKMNKMNIMNNNSLCFFMSTFLPSEPSHSASVGTWRAHLVVNFKEGLAWHLQARLRTWNAGDAGSDQAKWLKRTGTYFFWGLLMYKPSKLQLTTSWYVS